MCGEGDRHADHTRDNRPSAGAERRHPQGFAIDYVSKSRTTSRIMSEYSELTGLCQPRHRIYVSEPDRTTGRAQVDRG